MIVIIFIAPPHPYITQEYEVGFDNQRLKGISRKNLKNLANLNKTKKTKKGLKRYLARDIVGDPHSGIDISLASGNQEAGYPIRAITGGEVTRKKSHGDDSYVVIKNTKSRSKWVYAHINPKVEDKETVQQGEIIGSFKSLQQWSSHLHLEVLPISRKVSGRFFGYGYEETYDPVLKFNELFNKEKSGANGLFKTLFKLNDLPQRVF